MVDRVGDGSDHPLNRLSLAIFGVTGAVNLQLPLYGSYAHDAGLGSGAMALLLAGYVACLLIVLVALGGVSDAVGRRPIVLAALLSSFLATALVWASPTAITLGAARWLQGLGVGFVMGAATAWMAELSTPEVAAYRSGLSSAAGFGAGAMITALLGPDLAYLSWLALLAATACTLPFLPTLPAQGGRMIRRPDYPAGTLLPAFGIGVGWSVAGTIVAVLPGVLGAPLWSGVTLAVLLASGTLAQLHARKTDDSLRIGGVVLPLGTGVLATGVYVDQVGLVLLGAAIAGSATHGWLYVGGLRQVGQAAPRSAAAVSGFFVGAYLGFGMPAVLVGTLTDYAGKGLAFLVFAAVITAACVPLAMPQRTTKP